MTDRNAFEAHFKLTQRQAMRDNGGEYRDEFVRAKWEGWQAGRNAGMDDAMRKPATPLEQAMEADRIAFEAALSCEPPIRTASNSYPWGWCYANDAMQQKFREFCISRLMPESE